MSIFSCFKAEQQKAALASLMLTLTLVGCGGAKATATQAEAQSAPKDESPQAVQLLNEKPATPSVVLQAMPPRNPQAEQALQEAREALQKKQWQTLARLVPQAAPEPLVGNYAEYWLIRQDIHDTSKPLPTARIQQFIQNYPDTYLADRLKADWITGAARAADYKTVLAIGAVNNNNPNVPCARMLAMQQLEGRSFTSEEILSTFQPATVCWTMLENFYSKGLVNRDQLANKLRATLETTNRAQARRLAGILFPGSLNVYDTLIKNPRTWLNKQGKPQNWRDTQLITIALSRLARGDNRDAAASYVEKNWAQAIPKQELEWVWGQFGLVSALNTEPEAARWYRQSGSQAKTDYNHAWEVRSELLQLPINWALVEAAINKMSPAQQAEPVWVYWKARALAAQNNPDAATALYQSIQNEHNFYGQLANDELGQTLKLPPVPAAASATELAEVRSHPGLQRAIRLFDLGWRPEAVAEWNYALRGMNDRQLLATAELAHQEAIYDRVINTSLLTNDEIHFGQRFIAPFEGRVSEKAREIALDPAWVYGLIRQESRFITDARSRVGASGLMQLMPATAKWVAQKIGLKNFNLASVNDFDTNTLLGTRYLGMVLDQLNGSEVLATAGYNAGPGRPAKWRKRLKGPVEGAIFAETIPFTETRLYVKHVLSNAVYYSMLFNGQPQSLKERLGWVAPDAATQVALP